MSSCSNVGMFGFIAVCAGVGLAAGGPIGAAVGAAVGVLAVGCYFAAKIHMDRPRKTSTDKTYLPISYVDFRKHSSVEGSEDLVTDNVNQNKSIWMRIFCTHV